MIYHLHSFATSSGRTAAWRALSAALPGSTCRRQPKKGEVQRERRIGLEPLNYQVPPKKKPMQTSILLVFTVNFIYVAIIIVYFLVLSGEWMGMGEWDDYW